MRPKIVTLGLVISVCLGSLGESKMAEAALITAATLAGFETALTGPVGIALTIIALPSIAASRSVATK